jgi:hypothetical protein
VKKITVTDSKPKKIVAKKTIIKKTTAEKPVKISKTAKIEILDDTIIKPKKSKTVKIEAIAEKPIKKQSFKKLKNLHGHVMEDTIEEAEIEASKYLQPEAEENEKEIKPEKKTVLERHETTITEKYADDKIVLMVRDPHWCYVYWDLSLGLMEAKAKTINEKYDLVLRVYDVTDINFNGSNSHKYVDIQVNGEAGNWYINVWETNRSYIVDIGYKTASGKFIVLARSNAIIAPSDDISQHTDEEWMIVDEDFEELFRLSGGGHSGLGASENVKNRLSSELASGSVSSFSSPAGGGPEKKKGFFLNADTELILYGNTEKDASLTVKGEKIDLKEDGSFSLRFHLPNGVNYLPIEAVSSDRSDKITIKISVERKTE